jgi:diguanylate cyclase (GGDEF)-like protein
VFRDSGLAQLIVGPAGRISVANPAATSLMGTSSLAGANLPDLIAAPDRGSLDAFLATLAELPAGSSQSLGPVRLVGPGRARTVQMIGARTRGEGGFDALVIAVHEVPAAAAVAVASEPAVDPLTGVGTRARGLEALRRATRPGAPGCVLMVDLDGFGWINESLGTLEGDRILAEVAERLLHAVPPGATVARIDGDQFLVVSSSTPLAAALELAGVVFAVLAKPMHIAGTRVVTVSIGVAGLGGEDRDEVLGRAQSALAAAKEQGGQQIVIDGPTLRTYGRRHGDVAVTIRELTTDAQRARAQAAQAQAEAAQAQDEAARAQAEAAQAQDEAARAQREARTCPMTGLPNYLAYLEQAEELEVEARRTGTPVAVVFLDLDQFGTINKTFSWDQGTRTLEAVARVLESECRDQDRVFRFGGEEFVVLLPATDRQGAGIVAERLRAAVEAARIPHGGLPELPIVTLSVGVAAGRGPTLEIARVVKRADAQSQLAKATGRNRVQPPPPTSRPGSETSPQGGDVA